MSPRNFALLGVAGFVAPRHLKAIADTGNTLIAAVDPHDTVGVLDRFFPEAAFFTEIERFDRFLEKRRRLAEARSRPLPVDLLAELPARRARAPRAARRRARDLREAARDQPVEPRRARGAGAENGTPRVHRAAAAPATRSHGARAPSSQRRRRQARRCRAHLHHRARPLVRRRRGRARRGASGGVAANIGIHFFDMLIWLFGKPLRSSDVHLRDPTRCPACPRARARARALVPLGRPARPAVRPRTPGGKTDVPFARRSTARRSSSPTASPTCTRASTDDILARRRLRHRRRAAVDRAGRIRIRTADTASAPTSLAHPLC